MAGVSTVPAVLDRLVQLARVAVAQLVEAGQLPEDASGVIDGQPVRDLPDNVIAIGFTGEPGEEAVTDTRSREQATPDPDRERYEITCLASAWVGREDAIKPVRDMAYGMVDALNAEIMRDHALGGLVLSCRLATVGYTPMQTTDGAASTVRFVVAVSAFTGR